MKVVCTFDLVSFKKNVKIKTKIENKIVISLVGFSFKKLKNKKVIK